MKPIRICGRLLIIKQEVEARETSEGTRVNPSRATFLPNWTPTNTTTGSFVTNSTGIRCVYCNGDHFSALCTKVVSVKDRRDILKRSARCYNCLRSHHKSKDCDSRKLADIVIEGITNPFVNTQAMPMQHQMLIVQLQILQLRILQLRILNPKL